MKEKLVIFTNIFLLLTAIGVGLVYFNYHLTREDLLNQSKVYSQAPGQFLSSGIKDSIKEPNEVSMIAVGDVMLSRMVAKKIKINNDVNYPFLKVSDYLNTADLVFGNLETPITPGREIQTGEMVFRSDPEVAEALKEANFSVFSLANNHTPNFGEQGLKDTFDYLTRAGISYVGAGKNEEQAYSPVHLFKKGIKFAFLAYNDNDVVPSSYQAGLNHSGTAFMDIDKMVKSVKLAKEKADIVIVSIHSGNEYTVEPNQSQIGFARAAIEAGAEMVIGHHPHVVQKAEIYKGKYIFYSLGNFVFDQMWSQATKEGLMLKITFTKEGVKAIEPVPILIEDYAQPKIMEEALADEVLERLELDF